MTKMIDNELNRVVGGDGYETAFDSIALFGKGYLDKPFCQWDLITHWVTNSGKVDAAWAQAGVNCVTCFFAKNRYYNGRGERISRDEAVRLLGEF
jgi:hypothetical protein